MKPRLKPLHEQVIVLTGATSGIGLVTARAAAKAGARLVLVARDEDTLQALREELDSSQAGRVIYVVADVASRAQMQGVAEQAVAHFGGFDTWINDAGTLVWGTLWSISDEDLRKVIETNFWGVVNGSLVAVEHLRERGGALINLGSALSEAVAPLQGIYCASKHAVKAITDTLRIELQHAKAPVSVTLIRPSSTNTPINERAKNTMSHVAHLPGPTYTPDVVARAILFAATHPRRDIYIGNSKLISRAAQLMPHMFDWLSVKSLFAAQQSNIPDTDKRNALYAPGLEGREQGDNPAPWFRRSLYTEAHLRPGQTLLAAGATGLSLYVAWRLAKKLGRLG
ncbi:short-subunit dehydrogenase [Pseudomonas duriflava]|uniref:Short-subunit dehydrogenase n=1 Tax=Pseudomonas duriflava TaxID=459528 RepID=A0A562QIX0_9PSED|nr:SDR family oxidoreductase [Pseudomonas duriflava]TWI56665.1 short-subunit dehydrogenase [Pseudomonas duriflava]